MSGNQGNQGPYSLEDNLIETNQVLREGLSDEELDALLDLQDEVDAELLKQAKAALEE